MCMTTTFCSKKNKEIPSHHFQCWIFTEQESPSAWTPEAYRPRCTYVAVGWRGLPPVLSRGVSPVHLASVPPARTWTGIPPTRNSTFNAGGKNFGCFPRDKNFFVFYGLFWENSVKCKCKKSTFLLEGWSPTGNPGSSPPPFPHIEHWTTLFDRRNVNERLSCFTDLRGTDVRQPVVDHASVRRLFNNWHHKWRSHGCVKVSWVCTYIWCVYLTASSQSTLWSARSDTIILSGRKVIVLNALSFFFLMRIPQRSSVGRPRNMKSVRPPLTAIFLRPISKWRLPLLPPPRIRCWYICWLVYFLWITVSCMSVNVLFFKKNLLRERKRHTAHRVASPGRYLPWPGGVPTLARMGYLGQDGVPPPRCEQTDAYENSTFPHPSDAGGKNPTFFPMPYLEQERN